MTIRDFVDVDATRCSEGDSLVMKLTLRRYARKTPVWFAGLALLGMAMALSGCAKDPFPTAPVKGKVTCQGQPVTGGTVTLRPIGGSPASNVGKPASGDVQPDGTFVLGTKAASDGAVIGKHEVRYSAPAMAASGELKPGESLPASPYDGLVPQQKEVQVASGQNEIHIELVKANATAPQPPAQPAR